MLVILFVPQIYFQYNYDDKQLTSFKKTDSYIVLLYLNPSKIRTNKTKHRVLLHKLLNTSGYGKDVVLLSKYL